MRPIDAAVEELKLQNPPLFRATARKHKVDKQTLRNRYYGKTLSAEEYHETRQLLSNAQERVLVDRINTLCERGIPPTNAIITALATEIVGKEPGKNWAYEFIQRHSNEITSIMLEGFDLSRKKADNYISISQYFQLVCYLLSLL